MKKLLLILMFMPCLSFGQVIGAWNLNGNSNDASGNGYNGTDNTVTYVQGQFGQAASLTGSSPSVITLPSLGTFSKTSVFSISLWVFPSVNNTSKSIFTLVSSGMYFDAGIFSYSGKFSAYVEAQSTGAVIASSLNTHSTNKWYHVVATFNGSYVKIYENGVFQAQVAYNYVASSLSNNGAWYIGKLYQSSTSYYWYQGSIDMVRMFNYEMTPAQVKNEYIKGRGLF